MPGVESNHMMEFIYAGPWRAAVVALIAAGILWAIFAQFL
jgi:hypothetical protein